MRKYSFAVTEIKKPKFNNVCVLFKNSNFCSRMLEMYSKMPRFHKFSRGGGVCPWTALETGVSFFHLHLLQSFCHQLKTLLKP